MTRHQGLKGLTIEFTTRVSMDAAQNDKDNATAPLMARMALQLASLGAHMREGAARAKQAVDLMRTAENYDPRVHGGTDDEIADGLLAEIRKRYAARGLA